MDTSKLRNKAEWVWIETLKVHNIAPETRIASSLSPIEIFVCMYYGGLLKFFPDEPLHPDRDRLIISKGHGSICMYPILADLGFFSEAEFERVCKPGGFLGGIPDPIIPGYETVNGSLGHGLGVAAGIAVAMKAKARCNKVLVLTGDGELNEGACWEAIMFAGHHKLSNLTLIVDDNRISMLDRSENIIAQANLDNRLRSFGWYVEHAEAEFIDELHGQLDKVTNCDVDMPRALIVRTLKGRGVPNLEDKPLSHVMAPNKGFMDNLFGNLK